MNKSKWFLTEMPVFLLSFALVLTGDPTDPAVVAVSGVNLNRKTLTLVEGGTAALTATATPDATANKAVT
jgi:hypothetical protein